MLRIDTLKQRWFRLGWRLAALLALVAQGWVTAAPLSESRGFGLSAHVETTGNHRGHFTHDEASCAACSVLSLHVLAPSLAAVPVVIIPASAVRAPWASITRDAPTPREARPRAPPSSA